MSTKLPDETATEKMAEAKRNLLKITETGMGMTCGRCRYSDDMACFIRTAVFGELPRDNFQCPSCRFAFKRTHGTPTVLESGFIAPGPITLDQIDSRL